MLANKRKRPIGSKCPKSRVVRAYAFLREGPRPIHYGENGQLKIKRTNNGDILVGYFTKTMPFDDFNDAIQHVARGG